MLEEPVTVNNPTGVRSSATVNVNTDVALLIFTVWLAIFVMVGV